MKTNQEKEDKPSLAGKNFLIKIGAKRKIKGSLKDPSLCLRIMAVFLFVILVFGLISRSSDNQNDFYLMSVSKTLANSEKDNLFVGLSSNFLPESPEFLLVGNSALKASSPPTTFSSQVLGSLIAGYEPEQETRAVIIEHIVESGETLSSLTAKYGISLETIVWANNLTKSSILKIGQKLIILPVSGTVHHVKSGDTISQIADAYKGKTSEIIAFNQLSGEADIYIGDIVIVPGGLMPAASAGQKQLGPASAPLASSYFIAPVSSPYLITQGLHWYNAIDFSHQGNSCGRPVFAAAGGKVQKTGYDRTAGNYVRILHPNGVITFYGHLSAILASPGRTVSQGAVIGYIGNTGYTLGATGCHVHFEVRGAKNPFAW